MWWLLAGLIVLGVLAVVLRLRFPADAAAQLEPMRDAILGTEGPTSERLAELAEFDGHFGARRTTTLLHIVPGALFLALLPLQLAGGVRARFVAVHRWNGRALLVLGVIAGATGLYFGIAAPFAGPGETVVIVLVAVWFFIALLRAHRAIRRRDVHAHRTWMLRGLAAPVGVSVVRVVGAVTDLTLTPLGVSPKRAFVLALWIGWVLTFMVAEWWVRRPRLGSDARE